MNRCSKGREKGEAKKIEYGKRVKQKKSSAAKGRSDFFGAGHDHNKFKRLSASASATKFEKSRMENSRMENLGWKLLDGIFS